MNKIYFDTNIIIDIFDEKRVNFEYSLKVLTIFLQDKDTELFINSDSLTNIFYILRHRLKFDFYTTLKKLESIKDMFEIVSIEKPECEHAISLCKNGEFKDYEDALQYVCALKKECILLVTNNKKDFKNSSIEVKTTKELAKILTL